LFQLTLQEQWYKFTWGETFEDKDSVPKATNRKDEVTNTSGLSLGDTGGQKSSSSTGGDSGGHDHGPDHDHELHSGESLYPRSDLRRWKRPGSVWDYYEKQEHAKHTESMVKIEVPSHEGTKPTTTAQGCGDGPHVALRVPPVHTNMITSPQKKKSPTSKIQDDDFESSRFVRKARKEIASLSEAMTFYDSFLNEVIERDDDDAPSYFDPCLCTLNQLAEWLEETTHSSAFSGVGAPETGLMSLHKAVQARMPDRQVGYRVWGSWVGGEGFGFGTDLLTVDFC